MVSNQTAVCYEISLIIPFRADPSLPYLLERLEDQLATIPRHPRVQILVVDSGSIPIDQQVCRRICESHNVNYIYHNSEGQVFSIGAARDFGVCHALGNAITFLDVDLRVSSDYWDRLIPLMKIVGVSFNKKAFFVVPCLYLTQAGTSDFSLEEEGLRFFDFYQRWILGDSASIETLAPCSSVMVVDRLHYMSIGGHRPEFRGHGYEDFELYHRLISEENIIPRAPDYFVDKKSWDASTYSGFRSQFSLLGRQALMNGLFVVHLWHPRPKANGFYGSSAQFNRQIWLDFFKRFDSDKEHPLPLVDASVDNERVLFFGKPRTDATRTLRDIFPFLGNVVFVSEHDLVDDEGGFLEREFNIFITNSKIRKIVFPNPYGNNARYQIYQWARREKFPYFCWERGALPDSWFLDPNGFNSDSSSYSFPNWDRLLSPDEQLQTKKYISEVLKGYSSLEKQGFRIGGDSLAQQLNVGGRKVLFVPMQRPSDTVIRFLANEIGDYANFMGFVDEVAKRLKPLGWLVLCKRHPLETNSPPLANATYVNEDTHFIDLLELSDAVALVNSGVGLYAAMMGKPCYFFGDAFYSVDGVNKKSSIHDVDGFVSSLLAGYSVDQDRVCRFVNYLINDFYSFGVNKTKVRKESDGSLRNITIGIDFYRIKIPGSKPIVYSSIGRKPIQNHVPLFERFALDIIQRKKGINSSQSVVEVAASKKQTNSTPLPVNDRSEADKRRALFNKFKNKPYLYFRDSKNVFLRPLRFFFKKTN